MSMKLDPRWSFEVVYVRLRDGRRFEKTVEGPTKGRCEGCLLVVTVDPPEEAEAHVCVRWWDAPVGWDKL